MFSARFKNLEIEISLNENGGVDVFSLKPEFFFEKDFDGMLAGKTPNKSFEFNSPPLKIEDVLERIK